MISPSSFLEAMQYRWQSFSGTKNIVTPEVKRLWLQMGDIFRSAMDGTGTRAVVAAALGSGKSTAMKVWASLLPYDEHPGVLIVVRQIEDAERTASDINAWSGRDDIAFAYHSELDSVAKRDLDALQWKPVLVICHRGYETSLSRFTMADMHAKFEAMHKFRGYGRRRLVIVDESLELVYLARLTVET